MTPYQPFYKKIDVQSRDGFPSLATIPPVNWTQLISPYTVEVSKSVLVRAQSAVKAFFEMSRRPAYQAKIQRRTPIVNNASVLMAYDFHSDEEGHLYLVEINTNASGYLLSSLMQAGHDLSLFDSDSLSDLKSSFLEESNGSIKSIAIVDDEVLQQKMYPEFLMYQDLFRRWGWQSLITEASSLKTGETVTVDGKPIDFIYNRSTDFFFESPNHKDLQKAWANHKAVVSPQPVEYELLADKQRLIDFSKPGWLETSGAHPAEIQAIRDVLIPTYEISDFKNVEEIWKTRRSLFFKPKNSFGGKSVYRGESVSKKVFERLMSEDIIIQKFVPAQRMPTTRADDPLANWKFDLRFFVYRDRIQQAVARVYQGQVTNFASPVGGFSQIKFV